MAESYPQYFITLYKGKDSEKEYIRVCVCVCVKLNHCANTFHINYTSIRNKNKRCRKTLVPIKLKTSPSKIPTDIFIKHFYLM